MTKTLLAVVAIPLGFALLLGAEILHGVLGERLAPSEPYRLDGTFGAGEPLRMVWLGNSVAAGVGASGPDASLPRLVAENLGRRVDLRVFAVSGERVRGALEDQVPLVEDLDPPPEVVLVEIGANDVIHLTGGGSFRRDYDRVLDRALAVGDARVIALGLPAFANTPRFLQPLRSIIAWRSRRLDDEVRASALRHGASYVDIAALTEPGFAADPEGTHAADRFHPNDEGHRLWAEAVLSVLSPMVERLGVDDPS